MASATDKFKKVGANTLTSLDSPGHSIGGTSINVQSTGNWPTGTGVVFAIREVDSQGRLIAGTYTEWQGTVVDTTTIDNMSVVLGADQEYSAGPNTHVFISVSENLHNDLIDGILSEHNQDGTHSDFTPDGDVDMSGANSVTYKTGSVGQNALADVTPVTGSSSGANPGPGSGWGDVNPSVDVEVPSSGILFISFGCQANKSSSEAFWVGLSLSGANTITTDSENSELSIGFDGSNYQTAYMTKILTGLNSGTTTLQFREHGGGASRQRFIHAFPWPF